VAKTRVLLLLTFGVVILVGLSVITLQVGRFGSVAAASDVMLTGAIRSGSGEKMQGVTVSARLPGKTITTSVFTDADGEYYFPRMEPGKYKVWAQAVGFENGIADVDLANSITRQDFTLGSRESFESQMRGDEWINAMPEDTPQDQKMKEVFHMACMGCHPPSVTLKDRFDDKGWANIITVMSRISTMGYDATEDSQPNPLMEYYKEDLAAWLAKGRGPGGSGLKPKARPRPTGDETLAVIREYDVPQAGTGLPLFDDGSLWSEGAPSKLDFKNHHAIDGTVDFDGNVWFSDDVNLNPFRSVGKVDWKTGEVTNFKVPKKDGSGMAANVHDIITDHDGMVWFGTEGKLYRIEPRTGKMDSFPAPAGAEAGGMMAVDGKGGIWSPGARFDPKTGAWKVFVNPIRGKNMQAYTSTYGIAADQDGNSWVSQYPLSILIHHYLVTGESENVPVPKRDNPRYQLFTGDDRKIFDMMGGPLQQGRGVPDQYAVRKPAAGPGPTDALWAPTWHGESLVKIDIHTKKTTVYSVPWPGVGGYQAIVDKDGMVFVVFTDGDFVGKFNPKTEKWTRYDLPTVGTEAHGIQLATVDGRTQLTVPYFAAGKTSKIEFRTKEELAALKAETRKTAQAR